MECSRNIFILQKEIDTMERAGTLTPLLVLQALGVLSSFPLSIPQRSQCGSLCSLRIWTLLGELPWHCPSSEGRQDEREVEVGFGLCVS